MSKARLVITAVIVEGRSQAEVARTYEVSPGWVSKLVARYRLEGESAFELRSRRPKTSPNAVAATVVSQIVELRTTLVTAGLDAGPDTIRWHLEHHHGVRVSSATISRYLAKAAWLRRSRRRSRVRPTFASRPTNPTNAGSPTSPTIGS
jgi:transposase